jgi:hypothetical protein
MCEAGQNNDCYAGYSISSLQERKQRKLSQTQRQALNFNKNINNQWCRKMPTSRANILPKPTKS